MRQEHDVIRVRDLCERLGVTRQTVRRWEIQGLLPPRLPLSGRPRWSAATIEEWWTQLQRREPPGDGPA